jgi:hypothetical protein
MNEQKGKKDKAAAAGITGAIIGAGIAVAATKALSDKKTRAQLKKTALTVKGKIEKVIDDVKTRQAETKKTAEKKVEEVNSEAKN